LVSPPTASESAANSEPTDSDVRTSRPVASESHVLKKPEKSALGHSPISPSRPAVPVRRFSLPERPAFSPPARTSEPPREEVRDDRREEEERQQEEADSNSDSAFVEDSDGQPVTTDRDMPRPPRHRFPRSGNPQRDDSEYSDDGGGALDDSDQQPID
jgi:hypothetical protein